MISVDRTADSVLVEFEDGRTVVLEPDWLYRSTPASMTLVEAGDGAGAELRAGYIVPTDSEPPTDPR